MFNTVMDLDPILRKVLKPGRYTGGEYGQIIKDKNKIDARFAFLFPDIMHHISVEFLLVQGDFQMQ